MSDKPKIYVFSNAIDGGDGPAYALAEDGTVLGSHYCSDEHYAKGDLGYLKGTKPNRHVGYAKHYPNGYEMVFVSHREVPTHVGLQEAIRLNHLQGEPHDN